MKRIVVGRLGKEGKERGVVDRMGWDGWDDEVGSSEAAWEDRCPFSGPAGRWLSPNLARRYLGGTWRGAGGVVQWQGGARPGQVPHR